MVAEPTLPLGPSTSPSTDEDRRLFEGSTFHHEWTIPGAGLYLPRDNETC